MTLLVDTHAFLWFCQGSPPLSATAQALLEDSTHTKLVSIASCWEVAIKSGLAKLNLGEAATTYLPAALLQTGFGLLPISLDHATAVESLPLHHKDPFDRMLIAQSVEDDIPIVSADAILDAYGVERIW